MGIFIAEGEQESAERGLGIAVQDARVERSRVSPATEAGLEWWNGSNTLI
jgi:hypothetical protein